MRRYSVRLFVCKDEVFVEQDLYNSVILLARNSEESGFTELVLCEELLKEVLAVYKEGEDDY